MMTIKLGGCLIGLKFNLTCYHLEWMRIEGVQVHGFIVKVGLLSDVFVGTSLVHLYGNYGLAADAMKVFQEMIYKKVVSWTALMLCSMCLWTANVKTI